MQDQPNPFERILRKILYTPSIPIPNLNETPRNKELKQNSLNFKKIDHEVWDTKDDKIILSLLDFFVDLHVNNDNRINKKCSCVDKMPLPVWIRWLVVLVVKMLKKQNLIKYKHTILSPKKCEGVQSISILSFLWTRPRSPWHVGPLRDLTIGP